MRPRLVIFTKLFWPEGGGAELATYLIARNALSKHFDVTIVSGTRTPEPDILRHAKYVYWSALEARYKPVVWVKALAGASRIRRLVERADIVYIPSHTLIPLTAAVKAASPKAKVVLHLHNYQLLTYTSVVLAGGRPDAATDAAVELGEHRSLPRALLAGLGHYANYVNKLAAALADRIICVSRRHCEILQRGVPEARDKLALVYNPPPEVPPVRKELGGAGVLLYLGGPSFVKGFHLVLKAAGRLLRRRREQKIVMVGVDKRWALPPNCQPCGICYRNSTTWHHRLSS